MSVRRPDLQANAAFRNIHNGQRCFILSCGSSIAEQDLSPLKDEICISVSNFFVHKDQSLIRPRYHCAPKFCIPPFTEEDGARWFSDMDRGTGSSAIFLDFGDRASVQRFGLFPGRQVSYLYTTGEWDDLQRHGLDLTRPVPGVISVSVMALMIAIYMGFAEIYLLGCDHDWMAVWGRSRHFYDVDVRTYGQNYTPVYGAEAWGTYDFDAACIAQLWGRYRQLRTYAEARGCRIFNATRGGVLDVFPRVSYEALVDVT